ncbi:MAG: LysR family transcriptional regulator [Cloacibacillus evryensis]
MDIESLKFFIEVRNSGNITNTANAFYVTQSAVSKRLSMLEAELGVQLFQRGKGRSRAVITPAGSHLRRSPSASCCSTGRRCR